MPDAELPPLKLTTNEAAGLLQAVLPFARAIIHDPFTNISGNSKEELDQLMAVMDRLQQSELSKNEFAEARSAAGLSADEWYSLTEWCMWYKVKAPFAKVEKHRQAATGPQAHEH